MEGLRRESGASAAAAAAALALLAMGAAAAVSATGVAAQGKAREAAAAARGAVAASPEAVRPVAVGSKAPGVTLTGRDGRPVSLGAAFAKRPTVLVFYRGGWCPYCNAHLGQLQKIEGDLAKMGYQILAVSPDRPEELRKSGDKNGVRYTLLSDSDAAAAKAFGVAFRVPDETVSMYREKYRIDLEAASGRKHHVLPVPAVFVVGTDGVVRFAHANPDYKVRLSPEAVLAAAREAAAPLAAPTAASANATR